MSNGKTIKFSGKGQPGNLLDARNWIGDVVPGVNNTALITGDIGGTFRGALIVNNMMLLGPETITFAGTLNTAGAGACQGLMVCDGAEAIFTPGATLNDGNALIVGNEATGALLALGHGGTHGVINSVLANIGKQAAGVGTVTIDDAIWNNTGHAYIGDAGAGTLHVQNNGTVNFGGDVDMAAAAGASGKMTIAGGGSVTVAGSLRIGRTASPVAGAASAPVAGAASAPVAGAASASIAGAASVSVAGAGGLTVRGTLAINASGKLAIAGGTVTAPVVICNQTLASSGISGFGTITAASIVDRGSILASGGNLRIDGDIAGAGSIQIAANSTATLTGASLKLAGIAFIGANATLALAHGSDVTAAISGFAIGDIIAMANVDAVSFNPATGRLSISEQNAQVETLRFTGNFAGESFAIHQTLTGAAITLHSGQSI